MRQKGEQEVLGAQENKRIVGTVINVNVEKDSAFIEADDGQRYYTRLSKVDVTLYEGDRLSFETMLPVARNIKLA